MEWSWRDETDLILVTPGPGGIASRRFADLAEAERFVRQALSLPDARQAMVRALGATRPDLGGPALGMAGIGPAEDALAQALAQRLLRGQVMVWQVDEAATLPLPIGAGESEA